MLARTVQRVAPKASPTGTTRRRLADRSLSSTRTPVRHVTLPFAVHASALPEPDETIGAFLARIGWATPLPKRRKAPSWSFQLPTICIVNGQPILQRHWKRRRIKSTDVVEFWSRPWGGSSSGGTSTGKQVMGIVALVAIAAFAAWAGPAIFAAGSLAAYATTAAITIGGGLLVAALTRPTAGGTSADQTTDQVQQLYSASAQGNTIRLLQPLAVQYGRVKSFPDFAITPWSEFDGNDQYLNVLLGTGLGSFDYETLYVDDTVLWTAADGVSDSFDNVNVAFYEPATPVALFPVNVTQSSEVSGQQLTTTPVGGYVANASGSQANAIAVDLVFPGGCFSLTQDGAILGAAGTGIKVEAQTVDSSGIPTGAWTSIAEVPLQFATRNPQRYTIKQAVTPGRYQVRVSRLSDEHNGDTVNVGGIDLTVQDAVVWAGLRAFIDGPSSFPVSTVAIRIKANSQLTTQSAHQFGTLCTRKLLVWDTDTDTFVLQATRNPFWAVYDAAVDSVYGAALAPSKVDFQTIFDQAVAADARGDTFDYRFTAAVQVPEAFDTILKSARSRHRWSGDVLTFVRDEWPVNGVPRMLLTDRETVRGSLAIDYALNPDDAADAVIVEYVDEEIWDAAEVQYPVDSEDFTAQSPTRIRLDGIVNRDQAHREAAFYYLQSQLRRVTVTLDTEHDGRMLGFGSRVRVQTELPQSWGATGAVVGSASNILTVSPAPDWSDTDPFYIAIRTKVGRQFGPVLCTQGVDTAHVVLDGTDLAAVETAQSMTLADALARADGADDPSFDFGAGTARARDCVVLSGRPQGERVTLTLAVDNEAVHTTDLTEAPVRPTRSSLIDPRTPIVAGLYATFRQGIAEPIVDASWIPAAGAQYYIARVSYDDDLATWEQVYEGVAANFSAVVDRAGLTLQVQGVGVRHGPWAQVELDAPVIQIAPGTVGIESLIAGLSERVTTGLKAITDQRDAIAQLIASVTSEQDAANFFDKVKSKQRDGTLKNLIDDTAGDLSAVGARVTLTEGAIVDNDEALAILSSNVTTNYATNTSVATATASTLSAANSFATGAIGTLQTELSTNYSTSAVTVNARSYTASVASSTTAAAITTYNATVQATFNSLSASVSTNATAISTVDGKLAASYAITLDVNGMQSGIKLLSNGTTSFADFAVDHFTVGSVGHTGVPVFDVGTVGGVASVIIRGNLQADGSIVARLVAANQIITNTANIANLVVDNIHIKNAVITQAGFGSAGATNITSVTPVTVITIGIAFQAPSGSSVIVDVTGAINYFGPGGTSTALWTLSVTGPGAIDQNVIIGDAAQHRDAIAGGTTITATGASQTITVSLTVGLVSGSVGGQVSSAKFVAKVFQR